MKDVEEVGQVL